MDIDTLVKLTSRAWSLKILALLHDGLPGRQAPLLAASGAGRTAFAQSLTHLENLGLIERNPGHGHPLRPEFRLTEKGMALAPVAYRVEAAARNETGMRLLRRSWTIPVLAVARGPKPFSVLKRNLNPITDRALSKSLQDLKAQNWVTRSVDVETNPPRPYYQVINEGAEISRTIGLSV